MADAQAGWYPDPSGDTTKARYWNGAYWTDEYRSMDDPMFANAAGAAAGAAAAGSAAAGTAGTAADPAGQTVPQGNIVTQTPYTGQQTYEMSSNDSTLRLIAFIFNIIATVCVAVFIIPLAWYIPMTVRSWNIYKGKKPNTIAFSVCTLIFTNIVSGILLLVSTKDV